MKVIVFLIMNRKILEYDMMLVYEVGLFLVQNLFDILSFGFMI